jgi:hypothetical protein
MSWSTPVTDRAASDIANRTAKAFMNIADWSRIYDNALYLNGLYAAMWEITIPFTVISVPTYLTHCTAVMLNSLLTNIQNLWSTPGITVPGIVAIKTDWLGGLSSASPTYIDVNNWEHDLDLLNSFVAVQEKDRWPRTGVASTGAGMTRQNGFR